MFTEMKFENFMTFKNLELEPCSGLNVLLGAPNTGKTTLIKTAYCACNSMGMPVNFAYKLAGAFSLQPDELGQMVYKGEEEARVVFHRDKLQICMSFPRNMITWHEVSAVSVDWCWEPVRGIYVSDREIPEREASTGYPVNVNFLTGFVPPAGMSHSPGMPPYMGMNPFLSTNPLLNEALDMYMNPKADLLARIRQPEKKELVDHEQRALAVLNSVFNGRVVITRDNTLQVEEGQGITPLGGGMRKLGVLELLIRKGCLPTGSVLFWDEPGGIAPQLIRPLVATLLELQRGGIQVFLTSNDYVVLKEIDLQRGDKDQVLYHFLYKDEQGDVCCNTAQEYRDVDPNPVADAFASLYNREVANIVQK